MSLCCCPSTFVSMSSDLIFIVAHELGMFCGRPWDLNVAKSLSMQTISLVAQSKGCVSRARLSHSKPAINKMGRLLCENRIGKETTSRPEAGSQSYCCPKSKCNARSSRVPPVPEQDRHINHSETGAASALGQGKTCRKRAFGNLQMSIRNA